MTKKIDELLHTQKGFFIRAFVREHFTCYKGTHYTSVGLGGESASPGCRSVQNKCCFAGSTTPEFVLIPQVFIYSPCPFHMGRKM
jgi:hypothetical protein